MRSTLAQRIRDWLWNQPQWAHLLRGHYIETRSLGWGRVHVCSCDARWPVRPRRTTWPL